MGTGASSGTEAAGEGSWGVGSGASAGTCTSGESGSWIQAGRGDGSGVGSGASLTVSEETESATGTVRDDWCERDSGASEATSGRALAAGTTGSGTEAVRDGSCGMDSGGRFSAGAVSEGAAATLRVCSAGLELFLAPVFLVTVSGEAACAGLTPPLDGALRFSGLHTGEEGGVRPSGGLLLAGKRTGAAGFFFGTELTD